MTAGQTIDRISYGVIMAGGSGTRFWPVSRQRLPKHLLDIFGERTLLQETWDRIAPLFPPERILLVTAADQKEEAARQLPLLPPENILAEPQGKNTAPAIALAAFQINRKAPEASMVVLPADQLISGAESFRKALATALEAARLSKGLVTLGVMPDAPATGYGYIKRGRERFEAAGEKVYQAERFREKPSYAEALECLAEGCYLWNSGIFIWEVATILTALKRWLPEIYQTLGEIEPVPGTKEAQKRLNEAYEALPAISIDYGLMERADEVLVVPAGFCWQDVGSWDAYYEVSQKDQNNSALKAGGSVVQDSQGCLAVSPGKLVALVGVENLLIVETDDVLLVCRRGDSQSVRAVVEELQKRGKREYL